MRTQPKNRLSARSELENGFTLIEILVVIIIIGILAAIAIPIFINQQRAARDSATIQDVRNLASGIETALVREPEATHFFITKTGAETSIIQVSTEPIPTGRPVSEMDSPIIVPRTAGTEISLQPKVVAGKPVPGAYFIRGYNRDGLKYRGVIGSKYVSYDSTAGGIGESVGTVAGG